MVPRRAVAGTFGVFANLGGYELNTLLRFAVLTALLVGGALIASNGQSINDDPHVVAAVAPATYPAIARAANARGEVIIEVQIDTAGDVLSTKLISGHPLLQKVSEEAAKQWKFSPSPAGTKERSVRLTFRFQTVDTDPKPSAEFTIVFRPPYTVAVQAYSKIID